jgi:hypothetical protein
MGYAVSKIFAQMPNKCTSASIATTVPSIINHSISTNLQKWNKSVATRSCPIFYNQLDASKFTVLVSFHGEMHPGIDEM